MLTIFKSDSQCMGGFMHCYLIVLALFLACFEHVTANPKSTPCADNSLLLGGADTSASLVKQIQQGSGGDFNFKIWLSNSLVMGRAAFESGTPPPENCGLTGLGCEFPAGGCAEHLRGAGPWIGGVINGVRHLARASPNVACRKKSPVQTASGFFYRINLV